MTVALVVARSAAIFIISMVKLGCLILSLLHHEPVILTLPRLLHGNYGSRTRVRTIIDARFLIFVEELVVLKGRVEKAVVVRVACQVVRAII